MTRIKISVFIILLLVLTSIFSGLWINGRCRNLIELSVKAEEFFSSGEKDKTVETTEKIESEWENFRAVSAVLIQNNKLSEIDRICARITHLAENDSEELLSELTEFENMLDLLRNGEIPKINSIF